MSRTQSPPATAGQQVRLERTLLVVGVLALGFNLRGAITSLPPVFPELQDSLGLSSATISLLAATPVICFGVVSGFAAALARRAGEERVLLGAMIALTAGLVARGVAPRALLFPGTILLSGAIAVMNVLLSSLIKRRWPERAGFLIGLYITALSAGAIVASLVSVPLWQGTGGSVALTLGWLAIPAAFGALLWLPQTAGRRRGSGRGRGRPRPARPADPADGAPVRARLARHALHGHAVAALLRGAVLAADHAARPRRERGGRRRPARPDGRRQPGRVAGHPGGSAADALAAAARRADRGRAGRRPGRPAVRAARRRDRLGADPRRRPERGPWPRGLLHRGPRAARGGGRVAVLARPVGRLPARQRRPARGRPAALGDGELDRCRSWCCSRSTPCCSSPGSSPRGRGCCPPPTRRRGRAAGDSAAARRPPAGDAA